MDGALADLKAIHAEAARIVSDASARGVPVLSGRLRKSLRTKSTRTRGSVLAGSSLIPYAGPIHFGWPARNIEPQPFIYDALDARKDQVVDLYAKRVSGLVNKLDRETPG